MQLGQYILHRYMVDIIRTICAERGIEFTSLSNDWLLELTKDGVTRRILGYKFSLNDSVASSIASDKVAAHLLLKRAGLPTVEHVLLRSPTTSKQMESLLQWNKFVVKPLEGSGGYGVKLFDNAERAVEWIESTGHPAWAAAPFVDIAREIRIVLLDNKPLIFYEKQPIMIQGLKMFNLGLGAVPQDIVLDNELVSLASQAQTVLGLRLSAVDIIESADGSKQVLEVNSGFMAEQYMRSSSENMARTTEAYHQIISAVMASE